MKTVKLIALEKQIIEDPFFGEAICFTLDSFGNINDKKIVDAGCGNGIVSVFFASKGADVVGIDINPSVIEEAKELAIAHGLQNKCTFLCGSTESISINCESIDIVFSKSTLQYMRREDVLTEYRRILKPEGILALLENLPFNPFINLYRLRRRLFAKTPERIDYVNSINSYFTFTEISRLKNNFHRVSHREYHFFSMFAIYFLSNKNNTIIDSIHTLLIKIDNLLFTYIYQARYLAWYTAVICHGKKE